MADMKPWKCKGGHWLGQIKNKGHGFAQLILFRHAIDMEAEIPAEQDVMGILEGRMMNIECDVPGCGRVREWIPGKAEIEQIINHEREMEGGAR